MNFSKPNFGKFQLSKRVLTLFASAGLLITSMSSFTPNSTEWQLLNEIEGVKFFTKISDCGDQNYYVVKVENGNDHAVQVDYSLEMPKVPVRGPKSGSISNLAANTTTEGSCENELKLVFVPADNNEMNIKINATISQN